MVYKIEVILQSGVRFTVLCHNYEIIYDENGFLRKCNFKGCVSGEPKFIKLSEISAIIEVEQI